MTWVKLDDQLHAHPKVQRAWRAHMGSLGLHMLALSHAGAYLTDGHVSEEFVVIQLPRRAVRERVIGALVGAHLWEPSEGGWLIHDYLDYNEPRADVLARRRQAASRARAQAPAAGRARARVPARPTPDLFPQLASSKDGGG